MRSTLYGEVGRVKPRAVGPRRRRSISGFPACAALSATGPKQLGRPPLKQMRPKLSGFERTLFCVSVNAVDEWVDRVATACVSDLDESVRASSTVAPPTAHFLIDGLNPPYLGYVTCRPFYRGDDAGRAIAGMGLLGSMLAATRLVVSFENADLMTALDLSDAERAPTALVVVEADRHRHTVRWHPVALRAGSAGSTSVTTQWGPTSIHADLPLPMPVEELLALWRARRGWSDVDVLRVYARMEAGGYAVRWTRRPAGECGQPSWMRLLTPVL